jgi:alanine-glyoxylate transaminase/serine-glyoxylate transaminase/serine-pyruvate transaminase
VVCINGVFGMRMQENITRFGGVAVVVEDDWGTAVSLDKVEQTLKDNADAKILAFVRR